MNSHANVSESVWVSDESYRPKRAKYLFHFHRLPGALGLIAADMLTFAGAQWLSGHGAGVQEIVISQQHGVRPIFFQANIYWLLAAGFLVFRGAMGDYSARRPFWAGVKGTTAGVAIAGLGDLAIALPMTPIAELQALFCWIFVVVGIPAARQCARAMLSSGRMWKIPAAIIGRGPAVSDLCAVLDDSLALGFDVRWVVWDSRNEPAEAGLREVLRIPLTEPERIAATLVAAGCHEVIIAGAGLASSDAFRLVRGLQESGISVAFLPAMNMLPPRGANASCLTGYNLLVPCRTIGGQSILSQIAKRIFDIVVSACMLVVLSPLFLVIAAAIKQADSGPVTYAHTRVGRNGMPFPCLKFRTMVTDAESRLAGWQISNPELHEKYMQSRKLKDDPRITPIGTSLRRTSLDELPQLVNVLRGQMSLVGPRPAMAQELDQYFGPVANLYLRMRPGLTGLWQISGRSETGFNQRVLLDEWYVLNWSLWGDIVILIQTVGAVLSGRGAL